MELMNQTGLSVSAIIGDNILSIESIGSVPEVSLNWARCYGGSTYDYLGASIRTTDGGYLMAGSSWSNDGDVSGNHI